MEVLNKVLGYAGYTLAEDLVVVRCSHFDANEGHCDHLAHHLLKDRYCDSVDIEEVVDNHTEGSVGDTQRRVGQKEEAEGEGSCIAVHQPWCFELMGVEKRLAKVVAAAEI